MNENSKSGPARAGALIYAKDLARLSAFYRALLPMKLLHGDDEHQVLLSSDFQLIIHAIPPHIAATLSIATPPPRENAAIKLFFTVANLVEVEVTANRLGGMLIGQGYSGPGFTVRNGCDPEGNIFHLRETAD